MWVRGASLTVPFVAPFLFHAVYQAVNVGWTVKRFGCGCPPINDPGAWRFDANWFNLILWFALGCACGSSWWVLSRRVSARGSTLWLVLRLCGLFVLLGICANRLAGELWL